MPTTRNDGALLLSLVQRPVLPSHWDTVGLWLTLSGLPLGAEPSTWVGPEFGFNVGLHVGDKAEQVAQRRLVLQNHVGAHIVWLNQVHGCDAVWADDVHDVPLADASFTVSPTRTLAVMTADCLPVVLVAFDENTQQALGVGVVHAGWKGLRAGVLQACVQGLRRALSIQPQTSGNTLRFECFLGPAIGPASFEVGKEVLESFVQMDSRAQACFEVSTSNPNKFFADLYALAALALQPCGVLNVYGGGLDTRTDSRWFSHRRGMHNKGQDSGRFATLVRLLR